MAFFTIFFQMLARLIMIFTGYFFSKTGMMDEHTNIHMSRMIASVFNPVLILSNAANAVGQIPLRTMGLVALIAVAMFAAFIVFGMVLSPFFSQNKEQQKIFQLMFVFSNLGFIGIPVVTSVLGSQYVVYVIEFILVYNFIFYTYGVALMEGKLSASSLKALVNPGTVFGVVALFLIILGIRLPDFVMTALDYLGNVASPMALIAVGYTLSKSDLKAVFCSLRLYIFAAVKLLVLPLAMFLALKMVVHDAGLLSVCMVLFGMPVGNMPLILGTQKGVDCTVCGTAIILTTLLCVFTIPLLLVVIGLA